MTLTPEQKQAVAGWIAAGDNLSEVQKKLGEQFHLTMTYRDVRFLVDDLDLALKDPAPKVDANDVSKAPAAKSAGAVPHPAPGKNGPASQNENTGPGGDGEPAGAMEQDFTDGDDDNFPPGGGGVKIDVDKVTLLPGALASGAVTFSDGVTGKWVVDQYGRPGFTEISKPGYRPSPADSQAFVQELSAQLQRRGF